MFPHYCICNRDKAHYSILTLLAFFLCSAVSYAYPNGTEQQYTFGGLLISGSPPYVTNTFYLIHKTYYVYSNPPLLPIGDEYANWRVKTQRHQLAVPFMRLKSMDFNESQREGVRLYTESFWPPPTNMIEPPSAVRNCFAYGVDVGHYWVNSLEQYLRSDLGDYEQEHSADPHAATHMTHGGYPTDRDHMSKIKPTLDWWPPWGWHWFWEFQGKWGGGGVYRTSLAPIHGAYGDAGDTPWRLRR